VVKPFTNKFSAVDAYKETVGKQLHRISLLVRWVTGNGVTLSELTLSIQPRVTSAALGGARTTDPDQPHSSRLTATINPAFVYRGTTITFMDSIHFGQ
jgi:hypothetical protein